MKWQPSRPYSEQDYGRAQRRQRQAEALAPRALAPPRQPWNEQRQRETGLLAQHRNCRSQSSESAAPQGATAAEHDSPTQERRGGHQQIGSPGDIGDGFGLQ